MLYWLFNYTIVALENQLDSTDQEILRKLTKNARISFVQLAKDLGISNSMVHQRVNKLRQSEVINQATYYVNPEKLGYNTVAYSRIIVTEARFIPEIIKSLQQIEEVIECNNVTGKYTLILKVIARSNQHLRQVLYEKIHSIRGVEETDTIIVFETAFQRNVPISLDSK